MAKKKQSKSPLQTDPSSTRRSDYVDNVNQSLVYYIALKNAKVPVEMHLYAQGGHFVRAAAHGASDKRDGLSWWKRGCEQAAGISRDADFMVVQMSMLLRMSYWGRPTGTER